MGLAGGKVGLLEVRPDDAQVKDRLVLLILPALVFEKQLPAHVSGNALGVEGFLAGGVKSKDSTLHYVGAVDYSWVGAGVKLHRSDSDQGESNVSAARPGEVLVLLYL